MKEQGQFSPELDKAKSEAMSWLWNPKNRQDIRTFTHINPGGPYVFSAFVRISNYMKQLTDAELSFQCMSHGCFHKEQEINNQETKCQLTGFIDFELDDKIEDELAKAFVDDILLLSPASNGKRAIGVLDMLKNMSRPSMNPLGMLGNMLNGTEKEVDDEPKDDYPDEM